MNLHGKTAVVTGGASGIGYSTAKLLGKYGAAVVLTDIQENKGKEASDNLVESGIESIFIPANLTDTRSISELFQEIARRYEKIDILVNCAGVTSLTAVPDITIEEWNEVFSINLASAFFCSQMVLKYMQKQKSGKIVNIASNAGRVGGIAVGVHYSASKAGIICLTKSLALYAASFGVNINCVAPGPTATPMTRDWDESTFHILKSKIPLQRFGTPEEVGEAICFLASDKASFITGATLDVNGGIVMC